MPVMPRRRGAQYRAWPSHQPLSLNPPGLPPPDEDDEEIGIPGGPPHPYYGSPQAPYAPGANAIPARLRRRSRHRRRRSVRRARRW